MANVAGSSHVSTARRYCDVLKPDKKKVEFVLLVSSDDKVLGTKSKDEALAFAKKHDYHLVRLEEDKHAEAKKRKVYKLMSSQQMLEHEEELAVSPEATPEAPKQQHPVKNVIASSKITENDLTTKLKSVKKWLDKKCEIRVGVTGTPDSTKQLDAIYEKFEAFLGSEARFLQKRIKNGVLKFVILPPSEKKQKTPRGPALQQPATDEGQ